MELFTLTLEKLGLQTKEVVIGDASKSAVGVIIGQNCNVEELQMY